MIAKLKSSNSNESSNSDSPSLPNDSLALDSLSSDSLLLSTDSLHGADSLIEEEKKNFFHKVGDKVENHREKKAEKKGEEYEKKNNLLHKTGDKVEENN